MNNMHPILGEYGYFLDKIFAGLEGLGIDVANYYLDHMCYRVSTSANYERMKAELSEIANLLLENEVGGRLIAKFKLFTSIKYRGREISVIELPSPKEGVSYNDGLEHVEFVVNIPLKDFITMYPDINFNLEGYNKDLNRDVAVTLGGFMAKFHEKSLEEVIDLENMSKKV